MPETDFENRKRIENLRLQFWIKLICIIQSRIYLERNALISTLILFFIDF